MPDHPLKGRSKSPEHREKIAANARDPEIIARRVATRRANEIEISCPTCGQPFSSAGFKVHQRLCGARCTKDGCPEVQVLKLLCDSHYAAYRMARRWGYQRSEEWFFEKLITNPICDICATVGDPAKFVDRASNQHSKVLCVDHCHETDYPRGALCQRCNTLLGRLIDNPLRGLDLISYIERSHISSPVVLSDNSDPAAVCRFCDKEYSTYRGAQAHLVQCKSYRALATKPCSVGECVNDRSPGPGALCSTCARARALARKYGTTFKSMRTLLDSITCNACGEWFTSMDGRATIFADEVDHCHRTGRVRGIICRPCNSALGSVNDDINLIAEAVRYLETHQESSDRILELDWS